MDDHTDKRLTELEIKASFMDDMMDSLNQVIIRQQATLDLLVREVSALKGQLEQTSSGSLGAAGDVLSRARDNAPPHY